MLIPPLRPVLLLLAGLLVLPVVASQAEARVVAEAVSGEPFGVGRITFTPADTGGALDESRVLIYESTSRIHYPAISAPAAPGGGAIVSALGQLLGGGAGGGPQPPPQSLTLTFLFRGNEPLNITLYTPAPLEFKVTPVGAEPRLHQAMLAGWWTDYSAHAKKLEEAGDHPPLVQTYLTSMLSQRLGADALAPPPPPPREQRPDRPTRPLIGRIKGRLEEAAKKGLAAPEQTPSTVTKTQESLELILGLERLRKEKLRQTMLGQGDFGQTADLPLPPELEWPPLPLPPLEADIPVENLALHVPHECFYVRFGKFSNYLWLNKLLEEYGGDIGSMVTLRGYVPPLNKRIQGQLALEQNKLAEVFGDNVIADIAIIGRDTYVGEGAAIGILFEAKNGLLENDFQQQRKRALEREKANGATVEIVQIAGHDVSFLSTPDNRLRSFHAADGNYHLVTSSREMVRRFYEAGEGKGALGASDEFRFARTQMPLKREDSIFVYMSAPFFQGLLTPQYQIELHRRMQSVTDMEALILARLAAQGEGEPSETVEDLVAGGFLPVGFGRRPDGSGPVLAGETLIDSRRGARGTFLPVTDVKLEGVTAEEAARYAALAEAYVRDWKQLDPLMVGLNRFALNKEGLERLTIDGSLAPFSEEKYGMITSILGPPTNEMITPAPGDIISLQASVKGGLLLPTVPPHYLFLGIQDTVPQGGDFPPKGLMQTLQMLRSTPGYLGAWPKPGFLDILPFGLGGGTPDAYGFSKLLFGLWRRQGGGFSVLSFDPQLLADVTPHLRPVEAEQQAQVRLHVGDLSQSKISSWINATYYQRAVQTSSGNTRLLHLLNQQLHVPLETCTTVAENLLDAQLICTLSGEYALADDRGGGRYWESSKAPEPGAWMPEDYQAPLLTWFRGADASLIKLDDKVLAHIELDMQRKPSAEAPKIELPLFNLFGGGQKALKPKEKEKKPGAEELPPPLPPVPGVTKPKKREF